MLSVDWNSLRPVVPEWYNDVLATCKHGYRWIAFKGRPTRNHPQYGQPDCDRIWVRQLFSPEQLENKRWQEYLEERESRDADGSEPLAYTYDSSGCTAAITPDVLDDELAARLLSVVRKSCKGAPSDLGKKLNSVIRKHLQDAMLD